MLYNKQLNVKLTCVELYFFKFDKNKIMKKYLVILKVLCLAVICNLFFSCERIESLDKSIATENTVNKVLDTIQGLSQMKDKEVIWNDNGVYRKVSFGESYDPIEEDQQKMNKLATCSPLFSGNDRKAAKTSLATTQEVGYSTFNTFRNTLQSDTFMRSLGIPTNSTSNRVSQENRNINVSSSYLYAIKTESDGDLHMIIGDLSKVALTNCEASGYPSTSASSYTKIKTVRETVVKRFGTDFCGKSNYTIFSPPVQLLTFKGSLFFDVDHGAGVVGPLGYRPTTSWEVHPVSSIKF